MRVFVTGGTGFVGRSLVAELMRGHHQVRCLVRNRRRASRLWREPVEWVEGDVTRADGLTEAVSGCDAVVHLVGIITERGKNTFETVHVQGTRNILEAIKTAGIRRYLHMSALGSREHAASRYHRTKYEAERWVRESGLDYTVFRPSVIFGPTDRFVNLLAKLIRYSPVIVIIGDGNAKLQPVALSDVTYCFVSALGNPHTLFKSYSLGGPEAMSFEEIIDRISQTMGRRRLKIHLPVRLLDSLVRIGEKILPVTPLTRDQLIMLQEDNICDASSVVSDFQMRLQEFTPGIRTYIR